MGRKTLHSWQLSKGLQWKWILFASTEGKSKSNLVMPMSSWLDWWRLFNWAGINMWWWSRQWWRYRNNFNKQSILSKVPLSDSLIDCEDPECCYSEACSLSQYCSSVPDPSAIINSNPLPHHFSSFFDRFSFLIEDGSLQKFAKIEQFDKRYEAFND